ncbi:glycosyltransferase [Aurantibacter sp.]|uniref:glycosyltransferase n=1 Tax=Aurantibacter sp. TaxID=2807103 RepID=UPI0032630D4C
MNLKDFKAKLKNKIWRNVKAYFYDQRIADSTLVQNINLSTAQNQKKAIVSYVTYSHFNDWENNNIGRTQPFEILSMVKVLTELNYAIDIVGCHDLKTLDYLKLKNYDLIFGFGETFYQLTMLHPNAKSILYMTEHHPNFTKIEEQKRLDYFYDRKKKKANTVRTGNFYWDHHMKKKYTHVITMSETEPFNTEYTKPFNIFPTGILNNNFKLKPKNHDSSKKHFLWFGSYGAIHKGLDLLFDVFQKHDDIVLHVAGFYKDDRQLLEFPNKKNIIDYEYIDIQSNQFLEIIETCTYCILPSCSEGFSTAITTTMRHGLIPIVMENTGFNRLNELAFFLNDFNIEYIDKQLKEYSTKDSEYLASLSEKVFSFANSNFSIHAFESKFNVILNQILKND